MPSPSGRPDPRPWKARALRRPSSRRSNGLACPSRNLRGLPRITLGMGTGPPGLQPAPGSPASLPSGDPPTPGSRSSAGRLSNPIPGICIPARAMHPHVRQEKIQATGTSDGCKSNSPFPCPDVIFGTHEPGSTPSRRRGHPQETKSGAPTFPGMGDDLAIAPLCPSSRQDHRRLRFIPLPRRSMGVPLRR